MAMFETCHSVERQRVFVFIVSIFCYLAYLATIK